MKVLGDDWVRLDPFVAWLWVPLESSVDTLGVTERLIHVYI